MAFPTVLCFSCSNGGIYYKDSWENKETMTHCKYYDSWRWWAYRNWDVVQELECCHGVQVAHISDVLLEIRVSHAGIYSCVTSSLNSVAPVRICWKSVCQSHPVTVVSGWAGFCARPCQRPLMGKWVCCLLLWCRQWSLLQDVSLHTNFLKQGFWTRQLYLKEKWREIDLTMIFL